MFFANGVIYRGHIGFILGSIHVLYYFILDTKRRHTTNLSGRKPATSEATF